MTQASNKTMIVLAGPTGVGKTAAAIDLALHFGSPIVSADSRQCFQEMSIGVARPSKQELQEAPHFFIASHSIHDEVTAALFEKYALAKAQELFEQHDTLVMVGGTGLYIRAFCEGLDDIPEIPADLRSTIQDTYAAKGIGWLQEQLHQKDPAFSTTGEMQNPQRMMRALEVWEATGKSITEFRKGQKAQRDFHIIRLGLELPREVLYERINTRVDRMMQEGLLQEAEKLWEHRHLNAMQTVGYAELFDYLDKKTSLDRAVELIKQHTRHYAKRQMTWFKKEQDTKWFQPDQLESMLKYISEVKTAEAQRHKA